MSRRVLVVAPAWVGDMIMSQVIYAELRSANPDMVLDVLAPRSTLPLVSRMPEVSRGILIDQSHGQLGLSYRRSLGLSLAPNGYDQAIVTPNSWKSALVPAFAGIPKRTGFLGEYRYFLLNDIKLLDKKRLPLMTDRFMALVDRPGSERIQPALMVDEENRSRFIEENNLCLEKPVIGFCPGAEFGDSKKWPEAHYARLARSLLQDGYQVWIFGSPADTLTGDTIANAAGEGCVNLAGRTSLLDAVDLVAACESVVTNDSGLMHMAAAVGAKVVALYGSTSPAFTPPLTDKASIVSLELSCSPCFRRECPLGHKNCLNQLEADQVRAAL